MKLPSQFFPHRVRLHKMRDTTARDRANNPIRKESATVDIRARVMGQRSDENLDNRELERVRYLVIVPAGTDITAVDELGWNGLRLKIVGPPRTEYGEHNASHVELDAVHVTG